MESLAVKNLHKSFGKQTVLNGVSFSLENGKIYGLKGDNGCGKSVLMKCVCGLLPYDTGEVLLYGEAVKAGCRLKSPPGVLIEHPGFIENLGAYANLRYLASIRGTISKDRIRQVLSQVGLDNAGAKKVHSFSLGMRQRLAIAQALMENPPMLLLDEPFNGLDADARAMIRKLLIRQREEGKTILIVSHHLQDLDDLLDVELSLSGGKVMALELNDAPVAGLV